MSLESAIYEGWVTHRRYRPRPHDFRYRAGYLYIDLAELPEIMAMHPLWSATRLAPAWFRRRDYLGPADLPLDEAVRREVLRQSGTRPEGPVRLLTHPRYWGLCFNPVSFYYVFDPDGRTLRWVVADVTNTPWNEKHAYVLGPLDDSGGGGDWHPETRKAFHVSPFMEMDMDYRWTIRRPGEDLVVVIRNDDGEGKLFDAALSLNLRPWTGSGLGRLLWRHPWQSLKVMVGIYWQALRIWAKRIPYVPHPDESGGRPNE